MGFVSADEKRRLAALGQYQILDPPPEPVFDDITRLAAWTCQAPVALVSLVASTRLWFKSRCGLEVEETPRDASFCAHAILGRELFVVPDTHEDPRFAGNPLVEEPPHVRFYAGAPLCTPEGYALGTLCVIDYRPRTLTSTQERSLVILSHQVSRELELRRSLHLLDRERERSDRLLRNILPAAIVSRLKSMPDAVIADSIPSATVVFADIVGFTRLVGELPPHEVVALLDGVFRRFDELATQHGLEKIKTIGDAYMAVAGVPEARPGHVEAAADLALDMLATSVLEHRLQLRVGLHTGPVVAGVIGAHKLSYDVWGDTVNVASRMESQGEPGCIQVSRAVHDALGDRFVLEEREPVAIKGKGAMTTYFLRGRR